MSYSTYQPALAPTMLKGPYGAAWLRAQGIVKDFYVNRTRDAVRQAFPSYAAPDALGAIGDEVSIAQGIDAQLVSNETNAAYAARLVKAWDAWKRGGTAYGMLLSFLSQGYKPTIIVKNGTRWSLDVSNNLVITYGAPWTFDAPNFWNTFLVLFTSVPSSWTDIQNPPTETSSPSADEIAKLVKIVNLWRPGHSICAGIEVVTSGNIWGLFNWGSGTWGGTATVFSAPPQPVF